MRLVIFEDKKYDQLFPITLTRAVFELKCGFTSLSEKIEKAFPANEVSCFVRDYIAPTFKKNHPSFSVNDTTALKNSDLLIVNGRYLIKDKPPDIQDETWAEKDGDIIYAKTGKKTMQGCTENTFEGILDYIKSKTKKVNAEYTLINYPWELIDNNPEALRSDFKKINKSGIEGKMAPESVIFGPKENVYIAKGAEIHPLVCLDSRGGPIFIDEGAEVHPFTRIEGPCYVGKKSIVLGAKVREGCSIGPVCRIGGEVEESIFHAYSNKFHDGFIGHAYIGEWINIGAISTNSDLKNDYTNVSVYVKGKPFDTKSIKVGSFIGDHTKTSIGTFLNTGSNIGALCILVGTGGVLPKYIPTGIWFLNNTATKGFGLKSLLKTAETAMGRRKVPFTEEYKQLLEKIYEITKPDREYMINKSARRLGN